MFHECLVHFTTYNAETDALGVGVGVSLQLDAVQGYCMFTCKKKNGVSLLDFALYFNY